MAQSKLCLDLRPEVCWLSYAQAGLFIYRADDANVKCVHVSNLGHQVDRVRQEVAYDTGGDRYGITIVGRPSPDRVGLRLGKGDRW